MRGYLAFTKKEFLESYRNYRIFSVLALFLFIGFMSPLTAKFMPELIAGLAPELQEAFGAPTALDSWMQFYKNMSSLGMSLMLIIFCGLLSGEYARGTLVIMLTKGLPRPAVILSKFSAMTAIMTAGFWIGFLITLGYTKYFWPAAAFSHILFAAFALWVMGVMYLSILTLGCVLFRQAFGGILFLLVITVVINLLALPSRLSACNPAVLTSKNVELLSGEAAVGEFAVPMAIGLVITVGCLAAAVMLFSRKQI